MANEIARQHRLRYISWLFFLVGLIILGRLVYLQVIRHKHYKLLANETHFAKFEIRPRRGEIYVYDGNERVPLVLNQTMFTLYADPRFVVDKAATAEALAEVTSGDKTAYGQQLSKPGAYVVLEKRLDRDLSDAIRGLELPGVGLSELPVREYPESGLAAQVLGFVNDEGDGQYGLEQKLDQLLRGRPGTLSGAVDVKGVPIATAENIQIQARDGESVVLTIDRNLQAAAERILARRVQETGGKNGSVLVIDTSDGSIKAMANYPFFNPADFRKVTDAAVFTNPVVGLAYEPGSIIKAFTIAGGLERGVITPESVYRDTSQREIDNFTIRNSVIRPPAERTIREVVKLSLNTGSIFVLEQLGGGDINNQAKEALYQFFTQNLLLDQATGIELTGESGGSIDPPKGISDVRYANMTFGQGLKLTMIRMGMAFSALVNGGTYHKPRLIDQFVGTDGTARSVNPEVIKTGAVSPQTSAQMVEMMRAVVEDGAARRARRDGYIIGGKTGTAQKFNPASGDYYEDRVVSSFLGFLGNNERQYVIVIRVDEPLVTAVGAAPNTLIFADMSDWLIDYYGLRPVQ